MAKVKSKDSEDRKAFLDYIQDTYLEGGILKSNINWTLITAQIKNMMDNNKDMKYTGMKYCLWYMREILELNLFNEQGQTIISLLPFYYEESKNHWNQVKEISDAVENFEFGNEIVITKKEVDLNVKKWYNEIDMNDLI